MAPSPLCIESGQNKAGWCWTEDTLSRGPTPLPPPGQGGCSEEMDGMGWNVGGWRAPGGGPGSVSALVALRSQEAGWRVGNGRCLSTCHIHVWGGPRQLHARLNTGPHSTQLLTMTLYQAPSPPGLLHVKAGGGSHTHLPPPLKIYVYICKLIYNIEVCTPIQIFATNH